MKKICVVGACGTGKTCLLISYISNSFPQNYVPKLFEDYVVPCRIDGEIVEVQLCDTPGDHDRLRPLSYEGTTDVIACYSVVDRSSLEKLQHQYIPEVKHFLPRARIIIAATQQDRRVCDPSRCVKAVFCFLQCAKHLNLTKDVSRLIGKIVFSTRFTDCWAPIDVVSKEEGLELEKKLKIPVIECSALTRTGLMILFDECLRKPPSRRKQNTQGCLIY